MPSFRDIFNQVNSVGVYIKLSFSSFRRRWGGLFNFPEFPADLDGGRWERKWHCNVNLPPLPPFQKIVLKYTVYLLAETFLLKILEETSKSEVQSVG